MYEVILFLSDGAVLYANPRDNVTLPCFYTSSAKYLGWYKQVAGEQPQIISSFYKHFIQSNIFHKQFKDNKRFSVHAGEGFYHLNISNVQHSDSAMYYCGQTHVAVTEFDNGTFLVLKVTESVQPGGSVSLNCTVHTGISDTEHSVYWLKKDSHLGIMYVHTHRGSRCVDSSESGSPVQSCMYSLSKENVKLSDAGTYYCAMASCGQILISTGTRLDVGGEQHFFNFSISFQLYLYTDDFCTVCRADITNNEESDTMQYVALDFKKKRGKSRRRADTEKETIYSGVRVSDMK
uniref:Ig-like domain-containing protein n=1 Tax=Mastacembelus armatus TaxID=205130 RepID=A0A3Q3L7L6_9TELE